MDFVLWILLKLQKNALVLELHNKKIGFGPLLPCVENSFYLTNARVIISSCTGAFSVATTARCEYDVNIQHVGEMRTCVV